VSWTEADLAAVKAARLALAAGSRVITLTVGGKTLQYAQSQDKELKVLYEEIKAEVGTAAGLPKYVLTSTDKGL
jgi:hypothetical protein